MSAVAALLSVTWVAICAILAINKIIDGRDVRGRED